MLEEHSPSHLPLALSSFCRSEGITPPLPLYSPTPSTLHNPFESLTILDHISRNSHTVPFDSATPPLSPSHDAYLELYPVPPHLTPHPSPTQSRAQSPTQWYHHDHEPLPSTSLLGALTILVIEARGLSVTGREKPYVLLQYDRTESVSREFGAGEIPPLDSSKRKKAGLGGRSKSTSFSGPRGIVTTRRGGDTTPSPGNVMNGGRIVNDEIPTGDVEEIGTSANPIWNHCAKFDVVQPGRTILLCVYDKLADIASPTHGFLGASVFEPDLIPDPGEDGLGFEIWVPLQSALDPHLGGEVRLKILFETPKFQPKMCVDDFQVLQRIGEGSFGQVFRVKKRDTKRIYAMKVITKKSVRSSSALSQVLAERAVLARTLDSPFLVGLKFSFQSATELFFVIDYKSGGELFTHLQRDGGRFEEVKVRFYLCEIILALEYLHAHSIIYRDLKPENILLDGSGHIVLVDFGLSKLLGSCDELTKTMCGTTAFMAPEVLLDVGYNYRADWWSTGVLMYEMLFGFSPFYAETPVEEYERILGGEIKIADRRGHSPETRDLLARFLTRDPDSRLGANGGASEIKAHPFFASIDWVKCALRQISPPFKPRISADLDCEYHDAGRSFGDWVFSDGACFQVPSARNSMLVPTKDLDLEGDFRNFTFTSLFEDDSKPKVRSGHERRSSYNGAP